MSRSVELVVAGVGLGRARVCVEMGGEGLAYYQAVFYLPQPLTTPFNLAVSTSPHPPSPRQGVGASGIPLCFAGSTFHRVIPGFMCQGQR